MGEHGNNNCFWGRRQDWRMRGEELSRDENEVGVSPRTFLYLLNFVSCFIKTIYKRMRLE